jgi:hypothetical protein
MTMQVLPLLFAVLAGAAQTAPSGQAIVHVAYAIVSEKDTANKDSVTVTVKTGEVRAAVVWESECQLGAKANAIAAAPGVDQYWSFRTTLEPSSDGRAGVRVKYQRTRIAAAGPQPDEKEQWLPLDGVTPLTVTESSWRKNCRYRQFTITVTAQK